MAPGLGVDLLRVEAQRARRGEEPFAEATSPRQLADLDQRRDEPERADRERALLAAQPVIGLVGAVAQDEPMVGKLVGDGQHRSLHALVARRQEPNQR